MRERVAVDTCVWCDKPIYLDQCLRGTQAGDEVIYYHCACLDKARHSSGIAYDVSLEGCSTEE